MKCMREVLSWVFFGLIFIALPIWFALNFNSDSALPPAILAVVLLFGVFSFWAFRRNAKDKKEGFVLRDERTILAHLKAGYYAFMAALLLGFGLMLYNMFLVGDYGFPVILGRHVVAIFVVFMSLTFAILTWFFKGKGDVE